MTEREKLFEQCNLETVCVYQVRPKGSSLVLSQSEDKEEAEASLYKALNRSAKLAKEHFQ